MGDIPPFSDVNLTSLWPSGPADIGSTLPSWLDSPASSALMPNPLWSSGPAGIGADVSNTLPSWLSPAASSALTPTAYSSFQITDFDSNLGNTLPSWPNSLGGPAGLNLSGLLSTSTGAALETCQGLIKSFPRPISFLSPLVPSDTSI